MNKEIKEIYLSDVKAHPKGRCIDCWEFIANDKDPKACSCKEKKGYMTQNALRKLACKEYREVIRPEFTDWLMKLGYEIKDILDAIKFVRKEHPNEDYSTHDGQLTIEVFTRTHLEFLKPKLSKDCDSC